MVKLRDMSRLSPATVTRYSQRQLKKPDPPAPKPREPHVNPMVLNKARSLLHDGVHLRIVDYNTVIVANGRGS